jgi:hypothetical protein
MLPNQRDLSANLFRDESADAPVEAPLPLDGYLPDEGDAAVPDVLNPVDDVEEVRAPDFEAVGPIEVADSPEAPAAEDNDGPNIVIIADTVNILPPGLSGPHGDATPGEVQVLPRGQDSGAPGSDADDAPASNAARSSVATLGDAPFLPPAPAAPPPPLLPPPPAGAPVPPLPPPAAAPPIPGAPPLPTTPPIPAMPPVPEAPPPIQAPPVPPAPAPPVMPPVPASPPLPTAPPAPAATEVPLLPDGPAAPVADAPVAPAADVAADVPVAPVADAPVAPTADVPVAPVADVPVAPTGDVPIAPDVRPEVPDALDVTAEIGKLPDGRDAIIIGDPEGDKAFNHQQGDNPDGFRGTCGLVSVQGIALQFGIKTMPDGTPISEAAIVRYARERGLCEVSANPDDSGGSSPIGQVELLNDIGVPSHIEGASTVEQLAVNVQAGRGVIIGVNAGVFWNSADPRHFGNGNPNHAVCVTGVARDPNTGQLLGFYVNDSGNNQSGRFVDVALVQDAWQKRGGTCVVTNGISDNPPRLLPAPTVV